MEKKDVPQDQGILGHVRVICYATDKNGEYVKSQSAGWEPTNIANGIAWEFINEELAGILEKVKKKKLSPLAYHMNKNLMDVKLLSQYTGLGAWRVKRHLKPRAFNKLDDEALQRYASVFNVTVEQLKEVS
ncbi:MAG: hypothetical protein C0399_02290 [Syntrophus sp. (in: bacteria)]|nr:hypothetical protein [Syntrophus sp. (in: bacteria)]